MEENKKCNTHPTRKERFVNLNCELQQSKVALDKAKTPEEVNQALDKLSVLAEYMAADSSFKGDFYDFRGTIKAVRLHKATLKDLSFWFDTLCKRTNELIDEETKKEKIATEQLRALLTEALTHVDELAAVLDISKIFK
mgnify:CR=1 FL=1